MVVMLCFNHKTAYEMRIIDLISDVCSSDLLQSELAEDGHVLRGGFMPPVPLPRRMFAGGRIQFLKPIRIGEKARRTGRVTDLVAKRGRSGQLVFASVRREIEAEDGLAPVEEQDIVYRERSEERRVGKECVRTLRSRWW